MSLFTDMLGLFKHEKKGQPIDSSLQQGNNFNDMQNAISSSVVPQLPLIERTTQENLGSVVENFSNSETPLAKVNEREYKMITKTQNNFNKAISDLSRKHKALLLDPPKTGSVMVDWGGNHLMTNCDDYTSKVGPYKSKDGEYLANACHTGTQGVDCNKHFAGSSSVKGWERIACRTGKELQESRSKQPPSINNQLSGLYEEVNQKANVLRNQMHSLHAQRQNLTNEASVEQNNCAFKYCNSYPDLKNAFCGGKDCTTSSEASSCFNHWYQYGKKEGRANNPVACSASSSNQGGLLAQKGTLKDRLEILRQKENKIRKLEQDGDTLAGELEDNTLQVNSQQLRYMVWFVAAITLGLVAAKKSTQ